jgi:glycosyltransferase involved in cell wall biosynthesis
MKIAILTSGILPVPAVKGGAVENLTDIYLEYNDKLQLHDITVYSIDDETVKHHPALQSKVNHYYFIEVNSKLAKIRKRFYHWFHKNEEYYHYSIEYFLHQAIKHIRHQQYDIIILENRPAYALKLKDATSAKIAYHLHNEKLDTSIPRYQEIYDAATCILTVSNYIKSRVITINPHDTKTQTVYNGIDLSAFCPKHDKNRKLMGRNDNDFVLVFSGRMNRDKGIAELIEAMELLKDYPEIKLMVIGSSFFGNATNESPFIKDLKDKAAPLKERIIFTGFIPYAQMPDYLQMADVAVIPSVWDDPFPTTVLEAQAMGLPIIATRRGGIPEEVTEENAILLNTDDHFVENLTAAIQYLYEHPEKWQQMGESSLAHSKYYNKERYAKDFFKALDNI